MLLLGGCAGMSLPGSAKVGAAPQAPLVDYGPQAVYTRGNRSPYVVFGETYEVMPGSLGYVEIGIASWYGKKFHGRLTSNGEVYDMYQLTAAHKALPLPSQVRVTNLDNGRKVIVRVNDRGPFHSDRVIDLSYATAVQLGFADQGTAPVVIEAIDEVNYPQELDLPVHHESYYLQVGAFSQVQGAERLLAAINGLASQYGWTVDTRILQSELADSVLHKVWLGPISSAASRDEIAQLVEANNLGTPIRVKVD
jgi:rare lipoprotein A